MCNIFAKTRTRDEHLFLLRNEDIKQSYQRFQIVVIMVLFTKKTVALLAIAATFSTSASAFVPSGSNVKSFAGSAVQSVNQMPVAR
jgi:hypothetical protein